MDDADGPEAPIDDLVAQAGRDLAAAVDAYETVRREMNEILCEVRSGKTARARKLVPLALELARGVAALARERSRIDDARRSLGDAGRIDELDLAAARDEVRRRLARLRSAGP